VKLPFDPARVAQAAHARAEASSARVVIVTPQFNGEAQAEAISEIVPPEFADDAIALEFSSRFAGTLRYVDAWGKWMAWDGSVWRKDDTLRVYDLVRGICRRTSAEAKLPSLQSKIASAKTVAGVEKLARSDRRHAAAIDQWDADIWKLNTPRGVVDLTSGELLPSDPDLHMTKCAAVTPFGECPLWMSFLQTVTDNNIELQAYLRRVAGYCLTGATTAQAMFFAYGTGQNGKSTFLNTLQAIMGDYAMVADADTFTATTMPRHLQELARLQGARLVVAQETEEGKQLAEARVKAITDGSPITANMMRQNAFTYTPQFKLFISGNHKPALRNVDVAISRRFNLIPFEVYIAPERRDDYLSVKLRDEWPGILQWMVDGCLEWQEGNLQPPAAVQVATSEYFEAEDAFTLWAEQCCIRRRDLWEGATPLFRSWEKWAKSAGEQPGSQKRFSSTLESHGFKRTKSHGISVFHGIELNITRTKDDPQRQENERGDLQPEID
jgi:putative DNA primase/helicase